MGGCMSKLKPQGPSLNVYFKIAICRFLIRPFTCLFLLSCCYLELAIGSHALWHSVALTLSGRVITLSQLWNSGKFKAKKPEVSVISSRGRSASRECAWLLYPVYYHTVMSLRKEELNAWSYNFIWSSLYSCRKCPTMSLLLRARFSNTPLLKVSEGG